MKSTISKHRIAENILNTDKSELAECCRRYLEWLEVKNYSPRTITARYYILNFFLYWVRQHHMQQLALTSSRPVELFARHLQERASHNERPICARYHYQCLQIVKAMFSYLAENSIISTNPAADLSLPKASDQVTRLLLTPHQVEEILQQPDEDTWRGIRDRAILELLYSTGIRRRELVSLEISDLDLHAATLCVREGKGAKQRMVPIGQRAIYWLTQYLNEVRPTLAKGQDKSLFLTYKGTGFSPSGMAHTIVPYLRAAGYSGSLHLFRHAMATAMLENGASITHIQEILGHDLLSSTQIYTHVPPPQLRKIYDHTHPAPPTLDTPQTNPLSLLPLSSKGHQTLPKSTPKEFSLPTSGTLPLHAHKYLLAMLEKNMSPKTISKRHQHLRRFISWCDLRHIHDLDQVTHALLEHYHKHLHQQRHHGKPLKNSYISRHLVSLRCFFAWLHDARILSYNIALHLQLPKKNKPIPHQILTPDEISAIFAQVDLSSPLGLRERAILELLRATGVKPQELCDLSVDDLDFTEMTVRINTKKQLQQRTIPFSQTTCYWLKLYLDQVRPLLLQSQDHRYLFLGCSGLPLSTVTLAEIVRSSFLKAGVHKPSTCNIFRHTLAVTMLENGAEIRYVQKILGHTDLKSTQIYTKVSIRKLKEVHRNTHPTG